VCRITDSKRVHQGRIVTVEATFRASLCTAEGWNWNSSLGCHTITVYYTCCTRLYYLLSTMCNAASQRLEVVVADTSHLSSQIHRYDLREVIPPMVVNLVIWNSAHVLLRPLQTWCMIQAALRDCDTVRKSVSRVFYRKRGGQTGQWEPPSLGGQRVHSSSPQISSIISQQASTYSSTSVTLLTSEEVKTWTGDVEGSSGDTMSHHTGLGPFHPCGETLTLKGKWQGQSRKPSWKG
jgi:hypothetical protein